MSTHAADSGVRIFADAAGRLPDVDFGDFDILLTSATAPAPWVRCNDVGAVQHSLERNIRAAPAAAQMLVDVLRLTEQCPFDAALTIESLAYSTLLGGADFKVWLANWPRVASRSAPISPVKFSRVEDAVTLWLADPQSLNAYSHEMRDALVDALDSCLIDPTRPSVMLCAEGRAFCVGGALEEFGTMHDLAEGHRIRMQQSVAARAHRLGRRLTVVVRGAAIGAGIEIAAAAETLCASHDSWFQLPELRMGLIPGAGGTASVLRRIGRHRTNFLVISGERIPARQALDWRLIDAVTDG